MLQLKKSSLAALLGTCAMLTTSALYAGSSTYTNGDADNDITAAGNWSVGGPPSAVTETGTFNATDAGAHTPTLSSGNFTAGELLFPVSGVSYAFTISGASTLNLGGGAANPGVFNQSVNTETFTVSGTSVVNFLSGASAGNFIANLSATYAMGSGTTLNFLGSSSSQGATVTLTNAIMNLSGSGTTVTLGLLAADATSPVHLNTNTLNLSNAVAGDSIIAGVIDGTGNVTKNGTNTVTLANANVYTGTTTISGGTLILTGDTANMTGNILNNAALEFNQGSNSSYLGNISGTGTIVMNGVNTLILTPTIANTYSGDTLISTGTLQAGNSTALSSVSSYTIGATAILNLAASNSIANLNGTGSITLGANTLTVGTATTGTYTGTITGTGGLTKTGAGTLNIGNTPAYTGTTTISAGVLNFTGSTSSLGGDIIDNSQLLFTQGVSSTFTHNISGTGLVSQSGSATLNLSGINSYSGTTTIGPGTLQAGSITAFSPDSDFTINSPGTLALNDFSNTILSLNGAGNVTTGILAATTLTTSGGTFSGAISGAGGLTKQDTDTLILSGNNSYTGLTTISDGLLTIQGSTASTTGNIVNDGDLNFNQAASSSYTGNISGSGTVEHNGAGGTTLTLTPSIANTYSGDTTISTGTLQAGNSTALSPSSSYTIDAAGIMNLAASNTIANLNGTGSIILGANTLTVATATTGSYTGSITGTGGLTKTGAGTLSIGGSPSYSGTTTISAGILNFTGSTSSLGGNIIDNSQLSFTQTASSTFTQNITGTGSVSQNGSATLNLSGNNSYSGITTVNPGILQAGSTTAFSPNSDFTITSPGTLALNDFSNTILSLNGTGNVTTGVLTATTLTTSSGTFSGAMSGAGQLIKQGLGTLILTGPNSYSGGTTITSGTIQGDTTGLQGTFSIGAGTNLVFDQSGIGTFAGQFLGSGNIVKQNTGGLNLATNSAAFTGTTTINAGGIALNTTLGGNMIINASGRLTGTGTLGGNLTLNSGSIISPGNSIGTISVLGNFLETNATYTVEVNLAGQSDLIDVSGSATLNGGTVVASVLDGFLIDYDYPIITATGGVTGTFSGVTVALISANPLLLAPSLSYDPNNVFLSFETTFINAAATPNQLQVATQLDGIAGPNPQVNQLLAALAALPTPAARSALDQLSGVQHTTSLLTTELTTRRFIRRLYDPIRWILTDYEQDIDDCTSCAGSADYSSYNRRCDGALWLEVSGGQTYLYNSTNPTKATVCNGEVTLGWNATLWDGWTLGIAGSYDAGRTEFALEGLERQDTWLFGIYNLWRTSLFYGLFDIAVSLSQSDVHREINIGPVHLHAKSKPQITQGTIYGEVGYDFKPGLALIQPFIGLELGNYWGKPIREKGAGAFDLNIAERNRTVGIGRFGTHLSFDKSCNYGIMLDLAWLGRFTEKSNKIDERFAGVGTPFSIDGLDLGNTGFEGVLTYNQQFNNGWTWYAQASGEVWSRGADYDILMGLQRTF